MNAKIMAAVLLCCIAGIAQAETTATNTYRCAVHEPSGEVLRGPAEGYYIVQAKTEDEADEVARKEAAKTHGADKVDSVSCGPAPKK
ncbi:hypothetical protein J7J08_11430 [Stenotrophomonas sp. ISL-67]|uniref:hypothetical protein n=1 Tax=Stenotrophomonas sp. ISL-67 TaxID=2819171 RepID=UPI001BE95D44|nr:hypothetical protein [Stenotrophomonas sp. ISL-67]MBT2768250.1 hypothetical protein [Stenotrophomonas sp. ISL-67]